MATVVKDLGAVTAYAYAVAGGYSGTEAEFEALLGNIAEDLSEIENLSVTVTTLPAGSSATAWYSNGVLSLGIPKGDKGDKGDTGATGATGPTGNGISTITKTGTSGLVDTYTITFTNGDTTTFTVANGEDGEVTTAQMNAAIATALEDYAKVDGSYSSLTAGNAEQLVSTVGVTEKTPYLFGTTCGSADVGDRVKLIEITGGTVAWNQLVKSKSEGGGFSYQYSGSITYDGDTIINTAQSNAQIDIKTANAYYIRFKKDHKYLFGADVNCSVAVKIKLYLKYNLKKTTDVLVSDKWTAAYTVGTWTGDDEATFVDIVTFSAVSAGDTLKAKNFMVIDITQLFGSTIADYIYSLETDTAGAGVAKLKSWGFCTKPYYAYDAWSLLSVKTSAHKTVWFNQWDEEWEAGVISSGVPSSANNAIRSKNFCKILPDTTYYMTCGKTDGGANNKYYLGCAFYDADKTYIGVIFSNNQTFTTPSNAAFFKLTTNTSTVVYGNTYNHDICINLHWDGERDGEYEPYVEYNYPLDSDLELRGIPKLDASNNLYYDGDSYAPDGTVTRRYAVRAYEEGDATDGSTMITDGTNTLYKLTTPTTETADPYQETQVCNDFGTEEFVDSRTVPMPVGANALYQANLRAKLEMAPDSPDGGNGDYIVRQTDGTNEYVALSDNSTVSGLVSRCPACPTDTDGTFVLKATVADGAVTYAWTAES